MSLSVPPSPCFEPFIGSDCGGSPLHVSYYYKSGSRCEIAIWRGCPTRNKFQDEYECINTCIFTKRAQSEEYHNIGNEYNYQDYGADKVTIDESATTTIVADSKYEVDDEEGANGAGEKDRKEADAEEKADENAATENVDGENYNDGKNVVEADNENEAHEAKKEASEAKKEVAVAQKDVDEANKETDKANKEAGKHDEVTKIEATSEGTMELGSEDIGAN